jgi:hypothetical protein
VRTIQKLTGIKLPDDEFYLADHFSIAFFDEAAQDVFHSLRARE